MEWWNELTVLQQVFAGIAIPATIIMVIQFVLFLFGLSHGGEGGADVHTDVGVHEVHGLMHGGHEISGHHGGEAQDNVDAMRLFTLRSIIAFLSIGGWMGVAAISWKVTIPVACVMAVGAGWLAMYFVAWSIHAALRLQQSGNVQIENAIGKTGEVYIPIPASKGGTGKINIIVQDRLCELEAVTTENRELRTGEEVTVMEVASEGVLSVVLKNRIPEGIIIEKEI